jgi:predicted metal-dependent phosphotriesterase family hydrolase
MNESPSGVIMTVTGPIQPESMGFALPHEHIMSTFGADPAWNPEYPFDALLGIVLPYLAKLKGLGCRTILDCTAAYFGRHPVLLQRIAWESGMQIVTNTGYYAAANARYVPEDAYKESAAQIADRWSREWFEGIDTTGIRPGFIKTAVGDGPLSEIERKLIQAALLTHKKTGLTIQTHLGGNVEVAQEILGLLDQEGVHPSAWVWVHAHSMIETLPLIKAARGGAWISFDGINADNSDHILEMLTAFQEHDLMERVLLSHDGDSYCLGNFRPYEYILTHFVDQCLAAGFTSQDVECMTIQNPARAFTVGVKS